MDTCYVLRYSVIEFKICREAFPDRLILCQERSHLRKARGRSVCDRVPTPGCGHGGAPRTHGCLSPPVLGGFPLVEATQIHTALECTLLSLTRARGWALANGRQGGRSLVSSYALRPLALIRHVLPIHSRTLVALDSGLLL